MKKIYFIITLGLVLAALLIITAIVAEPSTAEKLTKDPNWCITEIIHDSRPVNLFQLSPVLQINGCNGSMGFMRNQELWLPNSQPYESEGVYITKGDSIEFRWIGNEQHLYNATFLIDRKHEQLTLKSKRTTIKAYQLP